MLFHLGLVVFQTVGVTKINGLFSKLVAWTFIIVSLRYM